MSQSNLRVYAFTEVQRKVLGVVSTANVLGGNKPTKKQKKSRIIITIKKVEVKIAKGFSKVHSLK